MKYINVIHRALVTHDPNDLLKRSLPVDNYLSEAHKISLQLPCCNDPHDLKKVIYAIFISQFSISHAGNEKDYWELANEIWSEIKKVEINTQDLSNYESVVVQQWEESERGWGTRPDGVSVHMSEHERTLFIKEYQESLPENIPHEYSRPCGNPFHALVPMEIYSDVDQSIVDSRGIRYYHYEIEICTTKNGTRYLRKK